MTFEIRTLGPGRPSRAPIRDAAGQPVPGRSCRGPSQHVRGNALGPHGRPDHVANRRQGPLPPPGPRARALHRVGRARGSGTGQSRANVRPVGRLDLVLGPASGLAARWWTPPASPSRARSCAPRSRPSAKATPTPPTPRAASRCPAFPRATTWWPPSTPISRRGSRPRLPSPSGSEAQVQIVLDAGTTVVGRIVDACRASARGHDRDRAVGRSPGQRVARRRRCAPTPVPTVASASSAWPAAATRSASEPRAWAARP